MTLLDERPAVAPDAAEPQQPPRSQVATWTLAARLARREVRRRPGRTLLVMLLVLVPVTAMTLASSGARTLSDIHRDVFREQFGSADLAIPLAYEDLDRMVVPGDVAAPDRVATVIVISSEILVASPPTRINVQLVDADLTNPMNAGTFDIREGRAPTGVDEVLLTTPLANEFGLGVGDTFRLLRPDLERTIVGLGVDNTQLDSAVAVVPEFDYSVVRPGRANTTVLVDLEGDPDAATAFSALRAIQDASAGADIDGFTRANWDTATRDVTARELAWGWVAGMLALTAVGVIIAAAFATTARRTLVTIGQLSANGAPEKLLRRTLALQGTWTGVLGSIVGIGAGVVLAIVAARLGWWDRIENRNVGAARFAARDLVVIAGSAVAAATVAAMLPARSAAKVPVLTALAGRRPVGTPPRWLGRAGVASVAGGLFFLFLAAASDSPGDLGAIVALLGALGVLFGVICAAPLLIAAVGRVASHVGSVFNGVLRLACRSLDRSRTRSAAVLTAISTVGMLATAGATSIGLMEASDSWTPTDLERTSMSIQFNRDYFQSAEAQAEARANNGIYDRPPERAAPLPDIARTALGDIAPDAELIPLESAVIDPPLYDVNSRQEFGISPENAALFRLSRLTVMSEQIELLLDLTDDQSTALDADGFVVAPGYTRTDGQEARYLVLLEGRELVLEPSVVPANPFVDAMGQPTPRVTDAMMAWELLLMDALVTPEFVERNDIELTTERYVLLNPTPLSDTQRSDVRDVLPGLSYNDAFLASASAPGAELGGPESDFEAWEAFGGGGGLNTTPWAWIHLAVAVASLLLVLIVVAIGLTLSATESRDERDVLHAIGASPATMRRVAASKAWVLCTCAAIVAIPAGYASMFVIGRATDSIGTAPFPTLVAASLLFAIPAIAAAATWTVSTVSRRSAGAGI